MSHEESLTPCSLRQQPGKVRQGTYQEWAGGWGLPVTCLGQVQGSMERNGPTWGNSFSVNDYSQILDMGAGG